MASVLFAPPLRRASPMQLITSNRDKVSHLRMFEDATFISVQELPPHVARALEGGKHRRSENFEEEEIPCQRISGDRLSAFLGSPFQRF